MKQRTKPIPERKIKAVEELSNLIKEKKTILIASIKGLPDSQFQDIRKKIRGKAIIKVPKKKIILRAIDSSEKDLKTLQDQIKEDVAILFSDLDCFELAGELIANKSPAKAKAGQEAPEDIEVQEGPTELIPGPAVSELGALGIQIAIEGGKINIKASKVIARKGEKISQGAADVMGKLDIKPFSVGFEPLVAFDSESGKLYTEIKIDKEKTVEELKIAFGKALPFALEIGYVCEDTIKLMISKAGMHEKALSGKLAESRDSEDKGETTNNENNDGEVEQKNSEDRELTTEKNPEPIGETNESQNTSETKSEEENN